MIDFLFLWLFVCACRALWKFAQSGRRKPIDISEADLFKRVRAWRPDRVAFEADWKPEIASSSRPARRQPTTPDRAARP